MADTPDRPQNRQESTASGTPRDDSDSEDWTPRSLELLRSSILPHQNLDHEGLGNIYPENSDNDSNLVVDAPSSDREVKSSSHMDPLTDPSIDRSMLDSTLTTQPTASSSEGGQSGIKRLHPPTILAISQPDTVSTSSSQTRGPPQSTGLGWIHKPDFDSSTYPLHLAKHLLPTGLNLEEDAEEATRHVKRSRRAHASKLISIAESQRLEEQLTRNLLRTDGRAGEEILPEHYLSMATYRHNLYHNLPTRILSDLDTVADLENILDFIDFMVPGRPGRERRNQSLLQTLAVRSFPRPLQSSHPSISYLPPPLPLGSHSIIYLSELIPRSFDQTKRSELLAIFRSRATYIPACINLASGLHYGMQYHVRRYPRAGMPQPNVPLGPKGQGWPSNCLPLEVFHIISSHLPRDALQNMRLVNREFESKISNALFHTVVVPFRPEIYGMMVQQGSLQEPLKIDRKGKGKELPREPEKRVHDGMRTFQGWGPHIKKFAMAFEVEESTLEKPPPKGRFETHGTFWGQYKWPHPNYNRYEYCEDLEKKADEFRCMSTALSHLTGVTELGLSIESGLGWLNGPDISDRARKLQEKPRIFGKRQHLPDASTRQRHAEWDQKVKSIVGSSKEPGLPARNGFYEATVYWPSPSVSDAPRGPMFDRIPDHSIAPENLSRPLIFGGNNIHQSNFATAPDERPQNSKPAEFSKALLIPSRLSSSQKEWLLEIDWAQRAFISSFCMALSDNSQAFSKVTSLNIARLSSRHLPSLQREDFWKALQNLSKLTIHVSADWRNIFKTATGSVEAPAVTPSIAAAQLYELLKSHISSMKNIKVLAIGYVGGGEHQIGIHGRNKNILPAPIVDYSNPLPSIWNAHLTNANYAAENVLKDLLIPKHVENLTFTNCWFPPLLLKSFCTKMRSENLKALTLDSVSLCFQANFRLQPPSPNTEDPILLAQGPPRYGDPSVADFFDLRPGGTKEPESHGWVNTPQRIGSWGQVIDFVTPGANLDLVRYAYQYYDEDYFDTSKRPGPHSLESITFKSCGYVNLPNFQGFRQDFRINNEFVTPAYLAQRASDLTQISMSSMTGSRDKFLGEIVTTFPPKETEVLETGFPMVFGWIDKAKAADCLEDAQPLGGSGRFSGKVQRLTYPVDTDDESACGGLLKA